jgi:hypothetical protein
MRALDAPRRGNQIDQPEPSAGAVGTFDEARQRSGRTPVRHGALTAAWPELKRNDDRGCRMNDCIGDELINDQNGVFEEFTRHRRLSQYISEPIARVSRRIRIGRDAEFDRTAHSSLAPSGNTCHSFAWPRTDPVDVTKDQNYRAARAAE